MASSDRSRECFPRYSDDNKRSFGTTQCASHYHPKRITGELIIKMKLSKMALIAAIACGTYAGNVFAGSDKRNSIGLDVTVRLLRAGLRMRSQLADDEP